jgi:hypothetical protein
MGCENRRRAQDITAVSQEMDRTRCAVRTEQFNDFCIRLD